MSSLQARVEQAKKSIGAADDVELFDVIQAVSTLLRTDNEFVSQPKPISSRKCGIKRYTSLNKQMLRSHLEDRTCALARNVLSNVQPMRESLCSLGEAVTTLCESCQHIHAKLEQTHEHTEELLQQVNQIRDEQYTIDKTQSEIDDFLQNFVLHNDEMALLCGGIEFIPTLMDSGNMTSPTNPARNVKLLNYDGYREKFLCAAKHAAIIRNTCEQYLTHHHGTAVIFEALDLVIKCQEIAMQRLYAWTVNHIEHLSTLCPEDVYTAKLTLPTKDSSMTTLNSHASATEEQYSNSVGWSTHNDLVAPQQNGHSTSPSVPKAQLLSDWSSDREMMDSPSPAYMQGKFINTSNKIELFVSFQNALAALALRRAYLFDTIQVIATARQSYIARSFFSALSRGGFSISDDEVLSVLGKSCSPDKRIEDDQSESSYPHLEIELDVGSGVITAEDDIVRFISDICAWTHQTAASERLLLDSLCSRIHTVQLQNAEKTSEIIDKNGTTNFPHEGETQMSNPSNVQNQTYKQNGTSQLDQEIKDSLDRALGDSFKNVAQPICDRITLSIKECDLSTLLRVADTATFYYRIFLPLFCRTSRENSSTSSADQISNVRFMQLFEESLMGIWCQLANTCEKNRVQIEQLASNQHDPDLAPSSIVIEATQLIDKICNIFNTSLTMSDTSTEQTIHLYRAIHTKLPSSFCDSIAVPNGHKDTLHDEAHENEGHNNDNEHEDDHERQSLSKLFEAVLGTIIRAILSGANQAANRLGLDSTQKPVLLLNSLQSIRALLQQKTNISCVIPWISVLNLRYEHLHKDVVKNVVQILLQQTQLLGSITTIQSWTNNSERMSEMQGLTPRELAKKMRRFYNDLVYRLNPTVIQKIRDPAQREIIRAEVCQQIANAHTTIFEAVSEPDHGYMTSMKDVLESKSKEDVRDILRHSPEEVKTLLGIS